MGFFRRAKDAARTGEPEGIDAVAHYVEVVGESYYQEALEKICGGKCREGHEKEMPALIVREKDNPYDANAIKVTIDGMKVGHLNRMMAERLAPALDARGISQIEGVALIVGGWDRGEKDQGHFGVSLQLPNLP